MWLLADPWRSPGWGLLDVDGRPKAPWHALRQVLASRTVFFTDEGLNGLVAHVANDSPDVLEGTLELTAFRDGRLRVAQASCDICVAPRTTRSVAADAILGRFADLNWSYRFGPPSHDAVSISLSDQSGTLLAADLYLPQGLSAATQDIPLAGRMVHAGARDLRVELESDRLAYAVRVEAGGWFVADNYVHITPGRRVVVCAAGPAESRPEAVVARAFNGRASLRIPIPPHVGD